MNEKITFDQFQHGRAQVNNIHLHYREAGEGEAVILLHGWPQHSLMWHTVAPILVERGFRVIAPDMRGTGSSALTESGYDKTTMAEDIYQLMEQLNIAEAYIAAYDLGSGVGFNLAANHPEKVKKLAVMEFGLPGFGYETIMAPTPEWDNNANWHLGLFTLPDVALMAFSGKEEALLSWFFWHIAYDGMAVSESHFQQYLRLLKRPGALRAGIMYYASVWKDSEDNKALVEKGKLKMPLLAVGGEASSGQYVAMLFQAVAENVSPLIVPKAGHWLGDENPAFLAQELSRFFTS